MVSGLVVKKVGSSVVPSVLLTAALTVAKSGLQTVVKLAVASVAWRVAMSADYWAV